MSKNFILDACALITLVKNETGADIVADVYKNVSNGYAQLYMNRINLLEVYYGFYRDKDNEYAINIINQVETSLIIITDFNKNIFLEAGRIKANYKISLADSIVLAQTIILGGSILTSDHHEFDAIEDKENIDFIWIR